MLVNAAVTRAQTAISTLMEWAFILARSSFFYLLTAWTLSAGTSLKSRFNGCRRLQRHRRIPGNRMGGFSIWIEHANGGDPVGAWLSATSLKGYYDRIRERQGEKRTTYQLKIYWFIYTRFGCSLLLSCCTITRWRLFPNIKKPPKLGIDHISEVSFTNSNALIPYWIDNQPFSSQELSHYMPSLQSTQRLSHRFLYYAFQLIH